MSDATWRRSVDLAPIRNDERTVAAVEVKPLAWFKRANCAGADSDLFFPPKGAPIVAEAKAICAQCPVRTECLDYAIDHNERYGIWGGMTERARRREKARRRQLERITERVA